jgi:hypothetical protein
MISKNESFKKVLENKDRDALHGKITKLKSGGRWVHIVDGILDLRERKRVLSDNMIKGNLTIYDIISIMIIQVN